MAKQKKPIHRVQMTEGKRNIIHQLGSVKNNAGYFYALKFIIICVEKFCFLS